jgi:hypothetical protein
VRCSELHPFYQRDLLDESQDPPHGKPFRCANYVCWRCATAEEEEEDEFLAPESSPRMAKYVLEKTGEMVTRDDINMSPPRPAAASEGGSAAAPATWPPKLLGRRAEGSADADRDAATCDSEASNWLGNDALVYSSIGVKKAARGDLRASLDPCNCSIWFPSCGAAGIQCINRATFVECSDIICSFGSGNCGNRPVTFHAGPVLALVRRKDIPGGFGCKTMSAIKAGEYVAEYIGEVISHLDMCVRTAISLLSGFDRSR